MKPWQLTLLFGVLDISILVVLVLAGNAPFTPSVRYHGSHQNVSLNYSYINFKYLKDKKLNITPINSFNLPNRTSCVKECLKTQGICKSLNVKEGRNGGFDCEVLQTDIYNEEIEKLIVDNGTTHYVVAVSIIWWLQRIQIFIKIIIFQS